MDMVSEFRNGRNKITHLIVTAENLNALEKMLGNFFSKNLKAFENPVVGYHIHFSFLNRLSSLYLIETCPSDDAFYIDYCFNSVHALVNSRTIINDPFLPSQVIINDLLEKNFKLFIVCVLGKKDKNYQLNYNVLTVYEKAMMLLNSSNCAFLNIFAKNPHKIDLTVCRTTGFNCNPPSEQTFYYGRYYY